MDGFLHFEGHFKPQHTEINPCKWKKKYIKTSWVEIYNFKKKKATNEKSWKEGHEKNDHPKILVDFIINSTLIHLERWKNHMIRSRFYPKKTALWEKKANRV